MATIEIEKVIYNNIYLMIQISCFTYINGCKNKKRSKNVMNNFYCLSVTKLKNELQLKSIKPISIRLSLT